MILGYLVTQIEGSVGVLRDGPKGEGSYYFPSRELSNVPTLFKYRPANSKQIEVDPVRAIDLENNVEMFLNGYPDVVSLEQAVEDVDAELKLCKEIRDMAEEVCKTNFALNNIVVFRSIKKIVTSSASEERKGKAVNALIAKFARDHVEMQKVAPEIPAKKNNDEQDVLEEILKETEEES